MWGSERLNDNPSGSHSHQCWNQSSTWPFLPSVRIHFSNSFPLCGVHKIQGQPREWWMPGTRVESEHREQRNERRDKKETSCWLDSLLGGRIQERAVTFLLLWYNFWFSEILTWQDLRGHVVQPAIKGFLQSLTRFITVGDLGSSVIDLASACISLNHSFPLSHWGLAWRGLALIRRILYICIAFHSCQKCFCSYTLCS